MKKYTAIIIDDEPKLQKVLQLKLEKYCPQIQVISYAKNAQEGYTLISQKQPDLLFLDISMPEETGFDLLDYFDTFSFEIIFVTGYGEYAIDALRLSAVDYLLKPVRTKLLVQAVQRAIDRIEERANIERYKVLKKNLNNTGSTKNKIAIPGLDNYQFIEVANILRCEGWDNYTKIHLANGEVLISSYTIGVIKDLLINHNFYSTHKSHLINVSEISTYQKDGTLILSDGAEVPISRRRRKEFVDVIIKQKDISL